MYTWEWQILKCVQVGLMTQWSKKLWKEEQRTWANGMETICNATLRGSKEKTEAGALNKPQPWLSSPGLREVSSNNTAATRSLVLRSSALLWSLGDEKHNPAQGYDKDGQGDPHPGLGFSTPCSKKKTLAHSAPCGSR